MCGRASLEPGHDVIVFENLRFRPSTQGERIWKPPFSVHESAGVRVDGSHTQRKKSRVDGVLKVIQVNKFISKDKKIILPTYPNLRSI